MRKEGKKDAFSGIDIPNDEILNNCIHCGLCLPTCPTYSLTGLERSSPRGRIRLIKAIFNGDIGISKEFIGEMNFCLDCQACETVCPAGIKYGSLVEAARAQIHQGRFDGKVVHLMKKFLLSWVFAKHRRLKFLARVIRFYQLSYIQTIIKMFGLFKLFLPRLYDIQSLAPIISESFSSDTLNDRLLPKGTPKYRIMFLTGCIMDVAFSHVNEDTVKLLLYHDCEVIIPKGQRCCGSLQAHNGDFIGAREAARYNIELFSKYEFDYIVMNSAGCGAFMKEYEDIITDDQVLIKKAKSISDRVRDITEFLDETGFRPTHKNRNNPFYGKRITYHDACHLIHSQRVSNQPRKLIKSIPGIEYIELPESTWCCGSAGIFNITHYDDSMRILKRKIDNIKKVQPNILVTGNPGCLLQLKHGLQKEGLDIELLHTATFFMKACEV